MATKNNIRSIRFSDEMANLIDQQPGETFTAKFETLIFRAVLELPQKEAELDRINKEIKAQRGKLQELQTKAYNYSRQLSAMQYKMEDIGKAIAILAKSTET